MMDQGGLEKDRDGAYRVSDEIWFHDAIEPNLQVNNESKRFRKPFLGQRFSEVSCRR